MRFLACERPQKRAGNAGPFQKHVGEASLVRTHVGAVRALVAAMLFAGLLDAVCHVAAGTEDLFILVTSLRPPTICQSIGCLQIAGVLEDFRFAPVAQLQSLSVDADTDCNGDLFLVFHPSVLRATHGISPLTSGSRIYAVGGGFQGYFESPFRDSQSPHIIRCPRDPDGAGAHRRGSLLRGAPAYQIIGARQRADSCLFSKKLDKEIRLPSQFDQKDIAGHYSSLLKDDERLPEPDALLSVA